MSLLKLSAGRVESYIKKKLENTLIIPCANWMVFFYIFPFFLLLSISVSNSDLHSPFHGREICLGSNKLKLKHARIYPRVITQNAFWLSWNFELL